MAVAIDLAASEKARQDGNTAFKKGKWTEAIGHYTTATIHNPDDPLGYANRAQAYLKLEKWADADRDCTTALSLPAGKGNVKALYRRALARKELGNLSGAKEDLEVLLRLEASNAVARTELAEVSSLMRKTEEQRAAKGKGRLPPSPPRPAAVLATVTPSGDIVRSLASTQEQSETASALPVISAQSSSASTIDKPPKTTAAASAPSPAASFADLRRSREGKNKKSFATSPATKPQTTPDQLQPPTVIGIDSPKLPKRALPTPDISAPGAGLQLLRSLTSSASDTWTALSLYPPDQIGRLLDGLLEPDSLGRLCVALRFGAGEGFQEQVHQILEGLKRTSRWGMNVAMLDTNEREAGQAAWSASGGEGRL